jgi:HAD superfamily hydrolase (TIGR01459 family)
LANRPLPEFADGLSEIAGLYDGVILDLWGVVHNGIEPFPDTIPTLKELKRGKRRVWFLSNAPRRAHTVVARLSEMGVTPDLYDGIMTSGEATYMQLRDRYLKEWGRNCYHLGPDRDVSLYEGLDINIVASPLEADFILNSGIDDFSDTADKYRPVLEQAASKNLPMICANPDRVVHIGDHLAICAGTLADVYEQLDGQVTWFGKPHRLVYRLCLDAMGTRRVLAVGDAMPTDIAGAAGAGIDSALVVSGIHREDVGNGREQNRLQEFLKPYPYRPNYIFDRLHWL